MAIAKSDIPQDHWFYLGRQLTSVSGGRRALISWTATMFEYLMPLIVMRSYGDTLLNQTYQSIVSRQIEYGQERGVPWGVSESAYNARDIQLNYQYGPFGVPGLGLKRGLSEDLVVSPYSTMLAAMISPHSALENARRLMREGALGRYGFYESIDYTPERLPQGQKRAVIRNFMSHHQGMILVSLANILCDNAFQRRFHAEPLVSATELLLQERIPSNTPVAHPRAEEVMMGRVVRTLVSPVTRVYDSPALPTPRTQLLSNGTYSLMITTAGSGYSLCGPLAVTRWREDLTRDHWGSFCYVRDVRSGAVWSTGYQPTARMPQSYEVAFAEYKVQLSRRDAGIHLHRDHRRSGRQRRIAARFSHQSLVARARNQLTSYAEVVLASPAADAAHPAFSNLFIETEFIQAENSLLARRRPARKRQNRGAIHTVVVEGETVGAVQYETDRSRFLGRGRTALDPLAVTEDRPLSNTVGAVLDPIFSLRHRVRLQPNETARLTFTTAVTSSREEALVLADKYHDASTFEREEKLSWTQAQVEMRHLNVDPDEVHLFQRLASRVLYLDPSLRPHSTVLEMNTQTQSALWRYGISGDLPIVLVRTSEPEHLNMVRQIIRGHEYLRINGLAIDLVILNDRSSSYIESLQDELQRLIRASGSQALVDKPGGVYLRRSEAIPEPDRILLHAAARVVIVTERGALEDQLVRRPIEEDLKVFTPRWPSRSYRSRACRRRARVL
ncbi:MAG: glucoamylase family protein [Pyrinomonadaceae bacterium]